MFEAYITNTALYPLMGIEVGTTVHFPMTTQELQAALAKIGIDGKRYSEVFFTSFDSDVLGLYDHLYECENIDELNELGHALLEVRDKGGLETFEAALVLGNHTRSVKDLINLTQNLDLYRFYPDISNDEGLGRLYADELGTIDIPEHMKSSKATIVSSFLLIFLTQANVGDFSLADNAILPVVLMVLSLIFAFLSIYNVETKDLN